MSFWESLVKAQPLEYLWRMATGTPSPVFNAAQNAAIADDIRRAGGSEAAVNQALQEVDDFRADFWPARDPLQTLADVAGGNPYGMPGQSDYTLLAIGFVVVVVLLLAIGYSKSGKTTVVVRGARRSRISRTK